MLQRIEYLANSEEPVSVADAQLACRIDDELSLYIATAIAAARQQAEQVTGRLYRGQRLREELECWPTEPLQLHVYQASALSITYRSAVDPATWTTLPGTVYRWSPKGTGTCVRLIDGQSWPELAPADWGVRIRIDVDAGPDDLNDTPESVRLYIMASVAGWSDSPAALIDGRLQPNPLHERLLDGERLWA